MVAEKSNQSHLLPYYLFLNSIPPTTPSVHNIVNTKLIGIAHKKYFIRLLSVNQLMRNYQDYYYY